jgi:ABC-type glutathione transport system ATPase component
MTVPANEAAEAIAHVEAIAHEPLASDAPEVVVRIENLSKSFDGRLVLDNVHLNVHKSNIVAIIGQSGSGKTR